MKVKNLKGTGDKTCASCGTWLEHWEKLSGETVKDCQASSCKAKAADGAHVKKVGSTDDSHYIIPLCKQCNGKQDAFELKASATLASAVSC